MKILILLLLIATSCSTAPDTKNTPNSIVYPDNTELKKGFELALEKLNLQSVDFKQFQAQYDTNMTDVRQEYILSVGDIKHYIDIKFDEEKKELGVLTFSVSNTVKQTENFIITQNESLSNDITSMINDSVQLQKKIQYELMQYINGTLNHQDDTKKEMLSLLSETREGVFKIIELQNHPNDNSFHLNMTDEQFEKFLKYWKEWNKVN
ncbi:MAG: hypothetical protein ACRCWI_01695 [Brevinema sp.]